METKTLKAFPSYSRTGSRENSQLPCGQCVLIARKKMVEAEAHAHMKQNDLIAATDGCTSMMTQHFLSFARTLVVTIIEKKTLVAASEWPVGDRQCKRVKKRLQYQINVTKEH